MREKLNLRIVTLELRFAVMKREPPKYAELLEYVMSVSVKFDRPMYKPPAHNIACKALSAMGHYTMLGRVVYWHLLLDKCLYNAQYSTYIFVDQPKVQEGSKLEKRS